MEAPRLTVFSAVPAITPRAGEKRSVSKVRGKMRNLLTRVGAYWWCARKNGTEFLASYPLGQSFSIREQDLGAVRKQRSKPQRS